MNAALRGEGLEKLEPILTRLGRGGQLPQPGRADDDPDAPQSRRQDHWHHCGDAALVAVLETSIFVSKGIAPWRINPARGIDLPDLDLGVKSPSENYCTSVVLADERLLGSEFDAVVLLTDYQQAKKNPPLKLQIIQWRYLTKTQIADQGLCRLALKHRDWLVVLNDARAKKFFRFLAYVNQGDWRARRLLTLLDNLQNEADLRTAVDRIDRAFTADNKHRSTPPKRSRRPWKPKALIPDEEMQPIRDILRITPLHVGVLDAADNWVIDHHAVAARLPNENEWQRLLVSPRNGEIGMTSPSSGGTTSADCSGLGRVGIGGGRFASDISCRRDPAQRQGHPGRSAALRRSVASDCPYHFVLWASTVWRTDWKSILRQRRSETVQDLLAAEDGATQALPLQCAATRGSEATVSVSTTSPPSINRGSPITSLRVAPK